MASRKRGRPNEAVALELAELFLAEFTAQEDPLRTLQLGPGQAPGRLAEPRHRADGHRPHGGRVPAPHAHGRGPRLPQHPAARLPHRAGRRLGRLADRHASSPTSSSARPRRCAATPTWACWARRRSTSSSTATSRRFPRCWRSPRGTRRSWPTPRRPAPRASPWPASAARPTKSSCATASRWPATSSSRNWPSSPAPSR